MRQDDAAPPSSRSPLLQSLILTQLREEGTAAAQAGQNDRAEEYLRQALAIDSDDADLWALLGSVSSDVEVRAACARRALALVPGHGLAQSVLAGNAPQAPAREGAGRAGAAAPSDGLPGVEHPGAVNSLAQPVPVDASFRLPASRLQPASGRSSAFRNPLWALFSRPRVRRPRSPRPAARPFVIALPRPQAMPAPRVSPQARVRVAVALVLLLVLGLNVLLASVYEWKYAGKIIPGVRIAGLDVSGLPPGQAEELLRAQVDASLRRSIRLDASGGSWAFSAADVGLRYLTSDAVESALALGHRGSSWASWRERVQAGVGGLEVALPVEAHAARLQAVLEQVSTEVDRPAIPPSVSWQEGNWVIAPGQDGRHVLQDETKDRLLAALAALVHGDAPGGDVPVLVQVPVVTDSAALAESDHTRLRLELDQAARPLTLRCDDHTWTLQTADIASWLRVKLAPPAIEVNSEAIRTFLSDLDPQVAIPAELPRMQVNGDGRVEVFQLGSDGRGLDIDTSQSRLETALERRLAGDPVETVDLLSKVIPAGQDALMAELGVLELIGEGHSSFADSSWARVTNIVVGGGALNGWLVAPGDVFSLDNALDPVTGEKGYVMSEIISGGEVGWGLGGGLCQVATTLYRAALNTGLEIVDRTPHLWRLDWYEQDSPPGFDATIMIGGPDLKFRNNTGHNILIQVETSAEGAWQKVRVYGTSPGWKVTIGEPVIAGGGHDVSFRRTVTTEKGQVLIDETVYSHYQ